MIINCSFHAHQHTVFTVHDLTGLQLLAGRFTGLLDWLLSQAAWPVCSPERYNNLLRSPGRAAISEGLYIDRRYHSPFGPDFKGLNMAADGLVGSRGDGEGFL